MSCAPSWMPEPSNTSRAAQREVYGGQTTTSGPRRPMPASTNAAHSSRVSAIVLFSFQLPAITCRRTRLSSLGLVQKRGDAGQFLALEEFEGGAAAGGDVAHLVGQAHLLDGGGGVAAADDGGGAGP